MATRIVALTPSMKKITVNFSPVIPEILRLICMGSEST